MARSVKYDSFDSFPNGSLWFEIIRVLHEWRLKYRVSIYLWRITWKIKSFSRIKQRAKWYCSSDDAWMMSAKYRNCYSIDSIHTYLHIYLFILFFYLRRLNASKLNVRVAMITQWIIAMVNQRLRWLLLKVNTVKMNKHWFAWYLNVWFL